ncbi:alpha/beta hydrolase [Roseobacteraceae bacterium S113]
MQSGHNLSIEAREFLAAPPERPIARTSDTLPKRRTHLKTHAIAAAPLIAQAARITTHDILIGNVPCLQVRPTTQAAGWTILYGFGGGFVEGSPLEDLTIIAFLCAMTGAQVIAPDYRLAPEHPWPAASDDMFEVYETLAQKPLAIVGESAGGNLVLGLLLRAQTHGMKLPKAAALLSPWCDLTNSGDSFTFNEGRDPVLDGRESRDAASHYVGSNDAKDPRISPINGTFDSGFPPFLITTGTRDLLLSQSVRLAERLRDKGTSVDLRVWDGMWHVFEWYDHLPEARRSLRQIAAFLSKEMNR